MLKGVKLGDDDFGKVAAAADGAAIVHVIKKVICYRFGPLI